MNVARATTQSKISNRIENIQKGGGGGKLSQNLKEKAEI